MPYWAPGLGEPGDAAKKYQWVTHGENCPMCQAMSGRVYWLHVYIDSTVYPGFHPNCDCTLKEVPIDTPQSDLDIFGSGFNQHYDSWIELLFDNPANLWWAYNVELTRNVMKFSQPGMTALQAIQVMQSQPEKGLFNAYSWMGQSDMGWNVFRAGHPDIYQTVDQMLTSWAGLAPKPKPLAPWLPTQTYHNPIYNTNLLEGLW